LINKNEKTTIVEMASVVGITKRNIEKNIKILKDEGILLREGGKKEGYWKVVGNEYLS
jgi:ATP-dependent DNA helicase RecG